MFWEQYYTHFHLIVVLDRQNYLSYERRPINTSRPRIQFKNNENKDIEKIQFHVHSFKKL